MIMWKYTTFVLSLGPDQLIFWGVRPGGSESVQDLRTDDSSKAGPSHRPSLTLQITAGLAGQSITPPIPPAP